ncbi:M23 family metallopeptidase [Flocculibacter collagenilyticus]|uniref:M23 family metallopeptidase n=1 Tax=Flocculibacter collagenilyticus TaxID=2744479 RepID=UPI0018F5E12A|nr:M23 family metallopeptidase [Flocculibacter collagenilyticus]
MSLTVFYRGKNLRFSSRLTKPQTLIVFAALITVIIAASSGLSNYRESQRVHQQLLASQEEYSIQKNDLIALKNQAKHQLAAMKLKLAEVQGQINRLNAFGEKLAEVADIPQDEFNFEQVLALGGPAQSTAEEVTVDVSTMISEMDDMVLTLDDQERKMQLLESILLNHHIEDGVYISGRPISSGWLSSYYGMRKDPFTKMPAMHKGIDFAGKEGADIVSTGSGVVTWAGERFGYGELIEIDHGKGLKTRYGHNKKILVNVGDVVEKGQTIAKMGSTGRSTGPHVHYEIIRKGQQLDPLKYVHRRTK